MVYRGKHAHYHRHTNSTRQLWSLILPYEVNVLNPSLNLHWKVNSLIKFTMATAKQL